jgi:hypothetical protein
VRILEESAYVYPHCQRCGLQVPPSWLNNRHYNTDICKTGMARRRQREAEQAAYNADQKTFDVHGVHLAKVTSFCYLGRILSFNNSDWPALYAQLKKAQQRWGMISRLLIREGASHKARGHFYVAIVQAVLLYGCKAWTVTPRMLRVLEGFHHKVARRISGKMARQTANGTWYYPPLRTALEEAGLFPIQEYIRRRQATLAQYIATRPILARCQAAPRRTGSSSRLLRYWQQDHSNAMDLLTRDGAAEGGAPVDGAVAGPGAAASNDDRIADLAALFGEGNEEDEEDDDN